MLIKSMVFISFALLSYSSIANEVIFNSVSDYKSNTTSGQKDPNELNVISGLRFGRTPSPISANQRFSAVKADGDYSVRGKKEIELFKKISPSVVLIATDEGIGSGSLVDNDGNILTNWHVIDGYEKVAVLFKPENRGRQIDVNDILIADVVKFDKLKDLALIKIKDIPKGITPIKLGDSKIVEIGQDVHAIGHPTGESWTYTKGLISQFRAKYKWVTSMEVEHVADVIQTQTPISPGNSGGPLLNDSGQIIGINSFLLQDANLINFAVESNEAKNFIRTPNEKLSVAKSTNCSMKMLDTGIDENGASFATYDLDCDGVADGIFTIPKDESEPHYFKIDTNGDGKVDLVVVDKDRDGKWDFSLSDTTGDGEVDMIGKHANGELMPYKFIPYEKAS